MFDSLCAMQSGPAGQAVHCGGVLRFFACIQLLTSTATHSSRKSQLVSS